MQMLSQPVVGLVAVLVVALVAELVAACRMACHSACRMAYRMAATSLKCICCRDNLILSRRLLCVIVVATASSCRYVFSAQWLSRQPDLVVTSS